MKILPEIYLWKMKNCLNFESHLLLDLYPGIFWKILQHCEIRHISTICLQTDQISTKSFIIDVSLDKEASQLNFGSHWDPDPDFRSVLDLSWRRSALSRCSC